VKPLKERADWKQLKFTCADPESCHDATTLPNGMPNGNMGMGHNPIPLVNIKIAGIYGCSSPKNGMYRY